MIFGYPSSVYTALGNPGWTPAEVSRAQLQQMGAWPGIAINPPPQPQQQPNVTYDWLPLVSGPTNVQALPPTGMVQSGGKTTHDILPQVNSAAVSGVVQSIAQTIANGVKSTDTAQKKEQAQLALSASDSGKSSSVSVQNGLAFGNDAFPAATQAAFGQGGQGTGYGGFAQGAQVSVAGPTINLPAQQVIAPSGLGTESISLVLIGGIVLVILLVLAMRR